MAQLAGMDVGIQPQVARRQDRLHITGFMNFSAVLLCAARTYPPRP